MYLIGILCLVAATAGLPVLPDPPALSNLVTAAHQDSEMQIYTQNAARASALLHNIKDNEVVKKNILKIGSVSSPPSRQPQLFDYSILRKQKAVQKQNYEDSVKQNPAALIDSVPSHQDSEDCANTLVVAIDSDLVAGKKADEEGKHSMIKIASIVIPPPSEVLLFDCSGLRKQNANHNLKTKYSAKQTAVKCKEDKETVILDLEKPIETKVPANQATLIDSVTSHQDSEACADTLGIATHSHLDADKSDYEEDEEVKRNVVKTATAVMPSPPELPPFDYSILRQQKADYNMKSKYSAKQTVEKKKEEAEAVNLYLQKPIKIKVPANQATLIDSVTSHQDSEACADTLGVATHSHLDADKSDYEEDEEVKRNVVKTATAVMPSPPELPPFDYSILRQQKADYNMKSKYSAEQTVEKTKEEAEAVNLYLQKPIKIKVPANQATLIDSVTSHQDSEACADTLGVATHSHLDADKSDYEEDEEVKRNVVKTATAVMPSPPELPPFDYSILRQQKADYNMKSKYSAEQTVEKTKEEAEAVNLYLQKPIKIKVPANQATLIDSVTSHQDSEACADTLGVATHSHLDADKSDYEEDEEVKRNVVKTATAVMPSPPELPPFDYSILRQQKADYNMKSKYSAEQTVEKTKEEAEAVNLYLQKPIKIKVPANQATLIDSVTSHQDSEACADTLGVATHSHLDADKSDYEEDEEVKRNVVKTATAVMPSPPELPPFDYSILRQQKADYNMKSKYSAEQTVEKTKEEAEAVNLYLEKPIKIKVPANQATLIDSVTSHQDSEACADTLGVATHSHLHADKSDYEEDEEVKRNVVKTATAVMPSPPELPPFDYSILRQQKADYNMKSKYSAEQTVEKKKEEAEAVNLYLQTPIKIKVPANQATLIDSVTSHQDSEACADTLGVATHSHLDADKSDYEEDEEVKRNVVKTATAVMPSPPELPPFDYSILRRQKADYNMKSKYSAKQRVEKKKEEAEAVNLYLQKPIKIEVPANQATLIDSVTSLQDSEACADTLGVATHSHLDADKSDYEEDEEVKRNVVKTATAVMPSPPELPPFDYSILRQQKADYNMKSKYSAEQTVEKKKEEAEAVNLYLQKQIKIKVPANQATLIDSVTSHQDSEACADTLGVATHSHLDADKSDYEEDEEVKRNVVKTATAVMPSPPELPPFDYSILRQQKADYNMKSKYSAEQTVEKKKEEAEAVNLYLQKPIKIKVPANQATLIDSVTSHQDSEACADTLGVATHSHLDADKSDYEEDEEVKRNVVKTATAVMPSPPELPPFDYSILRQQKADYNMKSKYSAKQTVEKTKEEAEAVNLYLQKPIKIKVPANQATLIETVTSHQDSEACADTLGGATDSHLVADKRDYEEVKRNMVETATASKSIEESKSDLELKLKEELKKEAAKLSEDIPVTIQWTITAAPFFSKLFSNCPPRFGLNWPLQKPSNSSCLIYPKLDVDGSNN